MKPTFKLNNSRVKSSCDQYHNIKGIHYECWTSDQSIFEQEKKEAKIKGLKFRIINEEFYRQVKK